LFNVFFVFGETRSGKSTFARIMANYYAFNLQVPFTIEENVHFTVEDLGKACEGKKHGVFILDEASNDLLASDRGNMFQKYLLKYFNTAAKFNQTFFILMPHLGQVKKDFLLSRHVFGIKTYFYYDETATTDEERWKRGRGFGYNYLDLLQQLDHYTARRYRQYMNYIGDGLRLSYAGEEPYMTKDDWELYEYKKDEAIRKMLESGGSKGKSEKNINKEVIENNADELLADG
jgi:hypothetical protein